MPDDLYTADILRWSGQQADLLRRLARGERVNDAIDWENVAEEVESVGRSELTATDSLLTRGVEHLLKIHCWPAGPVAHWRQEAAAFLRGAAKHFAPSMRAALDLPAIYLDAATEIADQTIDGQPPLAWPAACPWTIDDLIVQRPGRAAIDALLAALGGAPIGARLMPDDLYNADILRWSDKQAALLRRLARGERVNDAIDWENVIEEVESVGRSERQAVESLLRRAVEHLLKLRGWPDGPLAKWRHETSVFLLDARQRYSPSMGRVLDLPLIYASAVALINTMTYRSRPPRTLPERCPFTLSALIVPAPRLADIDGLLAALNRPETG